MRITCYAIGLLLLAGPAAATPSYVQDSNWQDGAGTSLCTMTLTGVTAGNNIVVVIAQSGADATAVYSVADGDTSYLEATEARSESNNREMGVHYRLSSTSGSKTISVTQTTSNVQFKCIALEFSTGAGTTAAYGTGSTHSDGGSFNDHRGSTAGINTNAQTFVISAGVLTVSGGTLQPDDDGGTVFTEYGDDSGVYWAGYYISATALTSEVGPWDNVGTARQGTNAIVSFHEVSAGTVRNCMLLRVCP